MDSIKHNPLVLIILTLIFSGLILQAQEIQSTSQPGQNPPAQQSQTGTTSAPKPLPDDISIEEQFSFMVEKSSSYQNYKVIREPWIYRFRLRLSDTIKNFRSHILNDEKLLLQKSGTIDSLNNELIKTNRTLESTVKEKNTLKLLGIPLSKTSYDVIMWLIILGLAVLLGFIFTLFKRSQTVTSQTKKDLQDLKDEYEDYRKKALKSKEDAVRMIYDELKKYKK